MNPKNAIHRLVFCNQNQDEKVIKVTRSAFILELGWIIICLLVFVGITYANILVHTYLSNPQVLDLSNYILYCFFLMSIFYGLNKFFCWFYSVNIITNQRILDFNFFDLGVKEIKECLIRNIETVSNTNTHNFFAFIFGISTLEIYTAGEETDIKFENIYHASQIQDIISDLQRGMKEKLK